MTLNSYVGAVLREIRFDEADRHAHYAACAAWRDAVNELVDRGHTRLDACGMVETPAELWSLYSGHVRQCAKIAQRMYERYQPPVEFEDLLAEMPFLFMSAFSRYNEDESALSTFIHRYFYSEIRKWIESPGGGGAYLDKERGDLPINNIDDNTDIESILEEAASELDPERWEAIMALDRVPEQ